MKQIASMDHDSILRDTIEAVKHFSWETVSLELEKKVPTLMSLLRLLVRNPTSWPFIASLASQIITLNWVWFSVPFQFYYMVMARRNK